MANWDLEGCCDTQQWVFISLFAAYLVIILLLWRTFIIKPSKLIAVFVHEMSHATACWLT